MALRKISLTAWLVMTCQLGLKNKQHWQPLVPDANAAFYRSCYMHCRNTSPFFWVVDHVLSVNAVMWLVEKILAFGAPQHFALRKQTVARQVTECIAQGTTQIINIGAGFDAQSLIGAQHYPKVTWFEIDTPPMHDHKMQAAREHFKSLPENFHSVACNLSNHTLREALTNHPHFSPDKRTLFIIEGVLVYLDEASVRSLLEDSRRLVSANTEIIFTTVEPDNKPHRAGWQKLLFPVLGLMNERFAWSMPYGKVSEFLASLGYKSRYQLNYSGLQRPYRNDEEMAKLAREQGEYIVFAHSAASHS